jgi:phosphomannomutase
VQTQLHTGIFKSYDLRGIYPTQLNETVAYQIGRCFVPLLAAKTIAIGRDMRTSSDALFESLANGAVDAGAHVVDIGMVSTDALYFAVGKYGYDGGIMITASHNPAEYNGMKFTRASAQAISLDTGLSTIRDQIVANQLPPLALTKGKIVKENILGSFANHCLSFIDSAKLKPFKIAIDAGNGMAGLTVPQVFQHLPCEIIPLYFEPDGRFPNHPANPLEPENIRELQQCVKDNGCDLGIAFDGDADRMFIVDERGSLVGGDIITALVAINTLHHHPGCKILYNIICSKTVKEAIAKHGGDPYRSPVGHSIIKNMMREHDITFGGEHSGHFYFKDNWYADSGMIALLQCLEVFSQSGKTVSETIAPIDTQFRSGEINSTVKNAAEKLKELESCFADAEIDFFDGLTITYPDWWMNVRASNTEPLLRLNVEANAKSLMEKQRDQALKIIRN